MTGSIKIWKNQPLFWWLIFICLGLIIYFPILNNFFASDDFHWLIIARDTPWSWQIFLHNNLGNTAGDSYNPLLVVFFKIFYGLFGTSYVGYHMVSILLHCTTAWLVYQVSGKIFGQQGLHPNWHKVAGLLFLIWPTQVEVVSWIAAWPHLWVSLLFLITLLFYFTFRETRKKIFFALSLVSYLGCLFFKELAISLPLVIFLWESYKYSVDKNKKYKGEFLPYLFLVVIFFALRQSATGLLFGYYGRHDLKIAVAEWLVRLGSYLHELVTFGYNRILYFKIFYYYESWLAILVAVILAIYFIYLLKNKKYFEFTLVATVLAVFVPLLPISLHRTTFAGERYVYLASVFFLLCVVWHLSKFKNIARWKYGLAILLAGFSMGMISHKLSAWEKASALSRQIVGSYAELEILPGEHLVSAGLPDNVNGAEVFRNNLQQALQIYYPDSAPVISPLYAYVQLENKNAFTKVLKWRRDDRGWFAESIDGGQVVTGITSISVNGVYYELWNYNYQNYLANLIRIIPDRPIKIITVEAGRLLIFSPE